MIRTYTILLASAATFLFLSCQHAGNRYESETLADKCAPSDQFAFQRSFPDRDFDWRGWRKRMSATRADYLKDRIKKGDADGAGGADWTLQGPGNVGGRVNALAIHPDDENTVLAGFSAGGIFKTTDGGVSWRPVFDDHLELSIGDVTYDPNNPDVVYAGTGDPNMPAIVFNGHGIYKSSDGGESWSYLALGQEGIISKVLVDPTNSNTLFAATMGNPYVRDNNRGVYKSIDGGITWQQVLFVSNQAGASDLVQSPTDPDVLYASFWDRIRNNQESMIYGPNARVYKSTDRGATWTPLGGGLPTGIMGRTGLAISQQDPDKAYVVYIDSLSTPGGLYKTVDGGASWTPVNVLALEDACGNFGWYFGKIRLNPTNDEEVYFLGIILWRKDAGSTQWQPAANSHADVHDLQFAPSGKRYLGCDGGVYRNTPGQMAWIKSNNLPTTQFYHTSYNLHEPDTYYAGAQDNGIRKGNGALYNGWSSVFPADGFRCAFHPTDPNTFWVETQNGEIHKTTDGGNNWQFGQPCLGTSDRCNWDTPYFLSQHNTTRLFAATYRVYFSENGSGWGSISGDLTDGVIFGDRFHTVSCLGESPVLAEKLLAGTSDGNVWRRDPAGGWVNISSGLPDRYVTSVVASPTLVNRIFVTHSGFRDNEYIPHVHRSDDNGATWTDIGASLPNLPVNDIYVLPGHADSVLFVATDAGVYFSRNGGMLWQRLGESLPFVPVFDLERNPHRNELLAATYARGLWTFSIDSVFTLLPPAAIAATGTVKTEDGRGVGQVRMCDQPWLLTGPSGAYEIAANAPCLANGLYPKRNDNPINGVSTFDLVLINRHILGISALGSPYKMIAADANNSRSITTFDIVALRKLILGIDTVLQGVDSWRFLPAVYTFPDPQNPFTAVFPEGVSLTLPGPTQQIDFIGIKVGDVNENVVPGVQGPSDDRNAGDWPLHLNDQTFRQGEYVRVVVSAPWENVAGAQLTLSFDPGILALQAVEPLSKDLSVDHFALRPNGRPCLTASFENNALMHGQRSGNGAPEPLFCAVFQATRAGRLRGCLQLADRPTPSAAFRTEGARLKPVLDWQHDGLRQAGVQAYPNPFGATGLWLSGIPLTGEKVRLRLFDAQGKLVLEKRLTAEQEHLPRALFPQKGVYWYEIQDGSSRVTGKVVCD